LPSGHFSSICGTFIGGIHPDTGRQYTIIEPQLGGWGAWEGSDGNPCIFSGFHGETYNTPAEISEARNGLFVDCMALNEAPGGEGEFSGGRGLVLEYRIRTETGFLTAGYTRSRIKPWSLSGAEEGSGNFVEVIKVDGSEATYSFVSGLGLTTDDVVRVVTSCGAGYGNPKDRRADAVRADIKNGFISAERAADLHGVTA
ncbi:MAG: hydantoinase B/oxoprolinase family protein, partial [Pseudomonadota bacterium]